MLKAAPQNRQELSSQAGIEVKQHHKEEGTNWWVKHSSGDVIPEQGRDVWEQDEHRARALKVLQSSSCLGAGGLSFREHFFPAAFLSNSAHS